MDASKRKAAEALDRANMEKLPHHVTRVPTNHSSPLLDRNTTPPRQYVRGLTFWTLLVVTAYLLLMASLRLYYWLGLGLIPLSTPLVLDNEVGRLPALGWNSWNAFGCEISEDKFITAAEKLIELGLKDAGYEYVNIDDCWQEKYHRDPDTRRMIPDPVKFPKGIKGTADKIHDLGLKIGIYSSAGVETCAHYVASLEYETIDAETWAEWGIDYLKYDNCGVLTDMWRDECRGCRPDERYDLVNGTCPDHDDMCPPGYNYANSNTALRYRIMRDALAAQNRTILYSICEWGEAGVQQWGNATGSSWRMSGDISANWNRILDILNQNSFYLNNVDFWGHSDADMLEVGNGNLTPQQSRSHFALWAAMKSPLLIGCNLATVKPWEVDIMKNKYLLAFNQDKVVGRPAMPYKWGTNPDWTFNQSFPAEYWSGGSSEGVLVLLFNPYAEKREKRAVWEKIPELKGGSVGLHGGKEELWYEVVDVWTGKKLGCVGGELKVEVQGHDTAAFLVTGRCCPRA